MTDEKTQGDAFAQQVAAALADTPQIMQAVIQPSIPPHIAGNILEFLRRVQSSGMEAIAWVEAYTYVQQHVTQQKQLPGVPFNGLAASPQK